MAKHGRKSRRKASRKSSGRHGAKTVARPHYSKHSYECYGKHVRTGKGSKRAPRVFCGRMK